MNGKYLLDANIIIAMFANEIDLKEHRGKNEEIFIPVIVIGELIYGARKSSRTQENINRVNNLVQQNTILRCDLDTAFLFGEIMHRLGQKGRPIPANDAWIAAIAIQHDLILVTRDAHFQMVDNLHCVAW